MQQMFFRKSVQLLVGLVLYGTGMALMIRAHIGVMPWDVLNLGLQNRTGLDFGLIVFLSSIVIFGLWVPLRQRPGIGTVANMLVIPFASQGALDAIPVCNTLWLQIVMMLGGIVTVAVASGLYIGVHLGPGPRDGLMTGLHARTGWPIWMVRTGIEIVVVLIGWSMGGDLGVGTIAFAVLIGPLVHRTMPLFAMRRPAAQAMAV